MNQPSPYTYTPQRTTQPYRQGQPRQPGMALAAMLNGRTLYGQNPMDQQRRGALAQALAAIPSPGVPTRHGGGLGYLIGQRFFPPFPRRRYPS